MFRSFWLLFDQHLIPLFFLFLQQPQLVNHSASNKRHRFKRSMRLRLSESSMNLSLEGIGSYSPSSSGDQPGESERLQKAGNNPQRRVHPGAGVLRRTPAVSPGSAEEEDMMSVYVPQVICVTVFFFCLCSFLNINHLKFSFPSWVRRLHRWRSFHSPSRPPEQRSQASRWQFCPWSAVQLRPWPSSTAAVPSAAWTRTMTRIQIQKA